MFIPLYTIDFKILREEDGLDLVEDQRLKLVDLLDKNSDLFEEPTEATTCSQHCIDTGDHLPIACRPYRLSPTKKTQLKEELNKMLNAGVIVETESPWAAPVVMIPKRTGGVRVCIDYRSLNAITKADKYPLPRVDDLLHEAKTTKFMSTLDLQFG